MSLDTIISRMKEIFRDIPYGIDHSLKVLEDATTILNGEKVSETDREMIFVVSILHDIGAVEAQRKHGSKDGVYQEKEGPAIAALILESNGYPALFIERACYIIGHHHTQSKIDGLDFQILWEADQLAALEFMEIRNDKEKLVLFIENNFRTEAGKALAFKRFVG